MKCLRIETMIKFLSLNPINFVLNLWTCMLKQEYTDLDTIFMRIQRLVYSALQESMEVIEMEKEQQIQPTVSTRAPTASNVNSISPTGSFSVPLLNAQNASCFSSDVFNVHGDSINNTTVETQDLIMDNPPSSTIHEKIMQSDLWSCVYSTPSQKRVFPMDNFQQNSASVTCLTLGPSNHEFSNSNNQIRTGDTITTMTNDASQQITSSMSPSVSSLHQMPECVYFQQGYLPCAGESMMSSDQFPSSSAGT